MSFNITRLFPVGLYTKKLEDLYTNTVRDVIQEAYRSSEMAVFNKASINQYILDLPELKDLRSALDAEVNNAFIEMYQPDSQEVKLNITSSWVAFTGDNQAHHIHSHPNSFLSGVFYLSTDNDSIIFRNPHASLLNTWDIYSEKPITNFIAQTWELPVEDMTLLIFPSWLEHEVNFRPPKESLRISLAFNTFPSGHLGNYRRSTELKL